MLDEKIESGFEDSVHDVVMGYDGKRIAMALSDGTIKIIGISNSSGSRLLASLKGHGGSVIRVSWAHPKFGLILASCSDDGKVIIWREGQQNQWVQAHVYCGHSSSVNSVAWAPQELGLCLACGSSDGSISIFLARDDGSWDTSRINHAHPDGVTWVSWDLTMVSHDSGRSTIVNLGPSLASRGCDNTMKVWKLDNGTWKMDSFPPLRMHSDRDKVVAWEKPSTLNNHHPNHHHQHRPRRLFVAPRADTNSTVFTPTSSFTRTSRPYPVYSYPAPTPTPTPSKHRVSSLYLPSHPSSKSSLAFLFLLLFSLRSLYSLLPFLRSSPPSFSLFPFSFLVSLLSFLLSLCFSAFPSSKTTFPNFKIIAIKAPIFSVSSLSPSQHKLFLAKSLLLSLVFLLRFQALCYCGTAAMILAELSGNIVSRYLARSRMVGNKNIKIFGSLLLFLGLFLLSISWDRLECFPFSSSSINSFGLLVLPRESCIRIWPMLLPFLSGFLGSYECLSMNWGPINQLGQKRVRLISLFYTTVLLFVPALLSFAAFSGDEGGVSLGNLGWPLANTVIFSVLLSETYGDEKIVSSKDFHREFLVTFFCTVVLELLYFPELSLGGILFCGLLLYFAARELDPVYQGYLELGLEQSAQPFNSLVLKPIRHILSERKSRKIALFLLINTGYMVVEFVAGFMSNSLGLISDACHMLFDCAALAIGLYASYISRLPANDQFNYGRGRFEVLSGYVNAVFLVLVGALIVLESFERILDPQEISTNSLLTVSIGGLVVNVIGLIFFHEEHHHAHGGSCSHPHSHSHTHHKHQHSHDHEGHDEHNHRHSVSHDFQKMSLISHDAHDNHHHCKHQDSIDSSGYQISNHHEHGHHHSHHDHCHNHGSPVVTNQHVSDDKHQHQHKHHEHSHHHSHHDHSQHHVSPVDAHQYESDDQHQHKHHEHSHHQSHHDHSHHVSPVDAHQYDSDDQHQRQHKYHLHHHHHDHDHCNHNDHHVDCSSSNICSDGHHSDKNISSRETRVVFDKDESQKPRHRHIDHNMEGIFLHVLADTMGSVGVVISTLLIKYKGWLVADPACSIFISMMIVLSVIPLLRNSAEILLQRVPRMHEQDLKDAVNGIMKLKEVQGIQSLHVWSFTNTDIVGTLNLHVSADTDKAQLRSCVLDTFQHVGVKDLTVQLDCIK